MKRGHLILTLMALTLVATLVPASTQQGIKDYDPWADMNDDGKIDIYDIAYVASKFGTEGTPINKTAWLLDLNATIARLLGTIYVDDINKRLGVGTTSPNHKLDVNGTGYFEDGIGTGESASGDGVKFGKKYSVAADINPIVTCESGYFWWDYSEKEFGFTETNAGNQHALVSGFRFSVEAPTGGFYASWVNNAAETFATLSVNGQTATFQVTSEKPDAGYIRIHALYSNLRFVAHYWYRYN